MGNDRNEFARIIIPRQYLNKKKITLINLVVQGEGGNKEDGTEIVRTTLVWDTANTNLLLALLLTQLAYAVLVMREDEQPCSTGDSLFGGHIIQNEPPPDLWGVGGATGGPGSPQRGIVFRRTTCVLCQSTILWHLKASMWQNGRTGSGHMQPRVKKSLADACSPWSKT